MSYLIAALGTVGLIGVLALFVLSVKGDKYPYDEPGMFCACERCERLRGR